MLCYKILPPSVSLGLSPRPCIQVWKGLEGSAESKMWTQKTANKGINISYVALRCAQKDEPSDLEGMTEYTDHLRSEPVQPTFPFS